MIRIAWAIGELKGYGKWIEDTEKNREALKSHIELQNSKHGEGTHWIETT